MTSISKELLLKSLISRLTGFEITSAECRKATQKADYTLTYDKCSSTSEEEVNQSIKGLIEKFSIKGHHDLSKALAQLKDEYLKKTRPLGSPNTNQLILKYDMLQLLLSLSSSSNQSYSYIPQINNENNAEKVLSWQDIINEDPLEGGHWQTWPDDNSNDDMSDDDGYEFDKTTAPSKQQRYNRNVSEDLKVDYSEQMDIDERGDPESLKFLVTQQYWTDDFVMEKENPMSDNLLRNPCQMSDVIAKLHYSESERQQMKVIPESGAVREVILLLRGYPCLLFQYEQDSFKINKKYAVQHVSQGALSGILKDFCIYGNVLSELRQIVTHITSNANYGQTSQAFADSIFRSLMSFDGILSQLEIECSFITNDSTLSISILKLRNRFDSYLQSFKVIHEIAVDIPFEDANARQISTYLLSVLNERTAMAQTSGQSQIYDMLLFLLEHILQPYGRIIDEWIYYGSLQADTANEFYVRRRKDISMNDSEFWNNGFYMEPVTQKFSSFPCPLFDDKVMSRIFFTGKAVNLLSEIEKIQKIEQTRNNDIYFFTSLFNEYINVKPPFIPLVNIVNPQSVDDSSNDNFTNALFPMKEQQKRHQQKIQRNQHNASHEELNDLGSIFGQNFIQFMEKYIEEPYRKTAITLNETLHKDCKLIAQLKSLASVYLMLENDLLHSFCEALFGLIDRNEPWFSDRTLNSTFTESCLSSGYDEMVTIAVLTDEVKSQVSSHSASYLELLDFKVEIPWPLNNFIQKHHITNYSRITGFLLRLKRARYIMEKKTLFRGRHSSSRSDFYATRFYSIRMRMLWFINSFWRYIMTTILHAETIEFRTKLGMSNDVDEIAALHTSYIRQIVDKCLLNDKANAIKKSILDIFDMTDQMATIFSKYMILSGIQANDSDLEQFSSLMNSIEKDFQRCNEFISTSLMIFGKKGGSPWFESLATTLSAN